MCIPFRDVPTVSGDDTLAERYELTMFRLERITRAGYQGRVQWECKFELPEAFEEKEGHLRTRDALYGGRTDASRLHYFVREG
jgi:hypothetical protein